jgi:hypothetical protein
MQSTELLAFNGTSTNILSSKLSSTTETSWFGRELSWVGGSSIEFESLVREHQFEADNCQPT